MPNSESRRRSPRTRLIAGGVREPSAKSRSRASALCLPRWLRSISASRIAAEEEFMIALMAENNVELQREWLVGAMGPPGPVGPPGEQGPSGKLPMVKQWKPETVYYAGDVVAYDGG